MWVMVVWALAKAAALGLALLAAARISERLGDRSFGLCLLATAIALRLGWVLFIHPEPTGDADWYHQRAVSLSSGGGYSVDGAPTSLFPPAYPLVLAAVYWVGGANPVVGRALNLSLTALEILLAWRLGRQLFGDRAGRLAAIALAIWPARLAFAGELLSEPLFSTAFLGVALASLAAARGRLAGPLVAGVCLGVATLTRPIGLGYVALLPAAYLVSGTRRWLLATLVSTAVMAAVVVPWSVRNTLVFGQFVPVTTSAGLALRDGHHVGATGLPQDANDNPHRAIPDELARDRAARVEALEFMRRYPAEAVRLYFVRLYRTYEFDYDVTVSALNRAGATGSLRRVFVKVTTSYYMSMMILFTGFVAMPLWRRLRCPLREWAVVVLPLSYLVLFQAAFLAQYRYGYPVHPFVAIGVGGILARWVAFLTPAPAPGLGSGRTPDPAAASAMP